MDLDLTAIKEMTARNNKRIHANIRAVKEREIIESINRAALNGKNFVEIPYMDDEYSAMSAISNDLATKKFDVRFGPAMNNKSRYLYISWG